MRALAVGIQVVRATGIPLRGVGLGGRRWWTRHGYGRIGAVGIQLGVVGKQQLRKQLCGVRIAGCSSSQWWWVVPTLQHESLGILPARGLLFSDPSVHRMNVGDVGVV